MISDGVHSVLEALGYDGSEGLVTLASREIAPCRTYTWDEVRAKFGIDAAYFHGGTPVVYFKGFETLDENELTKLHRLLWNHNRAPLLIAVLPEEVRVYNCFQPPDPPEETPRPNIAALLDRVQQIVDVMDMRSRLAIFQRQQVESGSLSVYGVPLCQDSFRASLSYDPVPS